MPFTFSVIIDLLEPKSDLLRFLFVLYFISISFPFLWVTETFFRILLLFLYGVFQCISFLKWFLQVLHYLCKTYQSTSVIILLVRVKCRHFTSFTSLYLPPFIILKIFPLYASVLDFLFQQSNIIQKTQEEKENQISYPYCGLPCFFLLFGVSSYLLLSIPLCLENFLQPFIQNMSASDTFSQFSFI